LLFPGQTSRARASPKKNRVRQMRHADPGKKLLGNGETFLKLVSCYVSNNSPGRGGSVGTKIQYAGITLRPEKGGKESQDPGKEINTNPGNDAYLERAKSPIN